MKKFPYLYRQLKNDRMTIYIKNMVCNRCILVVENIFAQMNLKPLSVKLGEVVLEQELTETQLAELNVLVKEVGFELIDSKRMRLIEQVKSAIISLVHKENNDLRVNLSDYIGAKVNYDYTYVSNLFSEVENTTIEKYFIAQKIERVKELLVYDELTLNEIAALLNYSSTAHLSAQFKKVTGLTPSHFKRIKEHKRKPLDKV